MALGNRLGAVALNRCEVEFQILTCQTPEYAKVQVGEGDIHRSPTHVAQFFTDRLNVRLRKGASDLRRTTRRNHGQHQTDRSN